MSVADLTYKGLLGNYDGMGGCSMTWNLATLDGAQRLS